MHTAAGRVATTIPTVTRSSGIPLRRALPRTAVALGVVAAVAAMALAGSNWIDERGRALFQTGDAIASQLGRLARSLAARDAQALALFYAADFQGSALGLSNFVSAGQQDGIARYTPARASDHVDSASAVGEWFQYLDSFSTIEKVDAVLERIEQWGGGGNTTALVRIELLGTLRASGAGSTDRFTVRAGFTPGGAPLLTSVERIEGERLLSLAPQFRNVGADAGIAFMNRYYPPFLTEPLKFGMIRYGPGGITTADYDNDGFLDLYLGRYLDPRLHIPTTFYARNGEPNQLYRNNGDGTFTNVTAAAGVGDPGLCLGNVWGDYDDDGFADLYVVNDFGRSTLYHNNRNGTFTDVTVQTGTLAYGAGMSASFADFDNDGRFDLYTTDIRSHSSWFAEPPTVHRYMLNSFRQGVWKSDMPLYFEMFKQSGLGFTGIFKKMASGNTLMRNQGDGTFAEVTTRANANPPGWFWGAAFADFNNDGWQDIYAADGWVYNTPDTEIELEFLNNVVSRQADYKTGIFFDPAHFGTSSWHGWERNRHLLNNGDGTFREIGHAAGTDLTINSRGVAVADFWNRGRLDIAVAASTDRHALLRNEVGAERHWLAVDLTGTRSNRDAVGARVTLRAGSLLQSREVVLGDGYGSQNALRQHFGLGDASRIDELRVRWPASGQVQVFRDVPIDRVVGVVEGRDALGPAR